MGKEGEGKRTGRVKEKKRSEWWGGEKEGGRGEGGQDARQEVWKRTRDKRRKGNGR